MTQYFVLAALIATLLAGIGGYVTGRQDGKRLERAEQDRAAIAVASATQKLNEAVAQAISEIEVKNVYTTQKLEKETVEKPVYRDCVHSDDAFRLLNDSLLAPEDRQDAGRASVSETGPVR